MKRLSIYLSVFLDVFILSLLPVFAGDEKKAASGAALITEGLNAANDAGPGFKKIGVAGLVGQLIQVILSLTGIIFLIITIYAGIMYMMAQGDDTKVAKAKKMLTQTIIGIIITISAYAISTFVIQQLQGAV